MCAGCGRGAGGARVGGVGSSAAVRGEGEVKADARSGETRMPDRAGLGWAGGTVTARLAMGVGGRSGEL